eukprot:TRINITY_DN1689_c0_g2_i4.p1 TRINITY_DN1689_c0_g2~~TRINITY_DN1689_c0_g2_i4.p1  ORF type:complete len:350 (+),score=127.72 TRINITY_DN1689_c0_g2_i4:332-1381(+)
MFASLEQYSYIIFLAVGYSLSAGLLVVINKWALLHYPYAANLTALQFSFSALVAWAVGILKIDEVDPLETGKVWQFLPAVVMFYISVAANLKLLEHANVDTYIVVRACVPLVTCFLEVRLMGSPVPSWKTMGSMLLIVTSSICYIYTDEGFAWAAYLYALLYLAAMAIDTILIKKVVEDVTLSRWGLVFYNNFIALAFFPIGSLVTGDIGVSGKGFDNRSFTLLTERHVLIPVIVSCVVGVAISFFGLNTRKALTATSFTVLGVVNKFLTLFVNRFVWVHHANTAGMLCAGMTIFGGVLYQYFMGQESITKRKEKSPVANPKPASFVEKKDMDHPAQNRSYTAPPGMHK